MNRRGYSLRKVRKTKPLKKIPETNEIFDNVQAAHQRSVTFADQHNLTIELVYYPPYHSKPNLVAHQCNCLIIRAGVIPTALLRCCGLAGAPILPRCLKAPKSQLPKLVEYFAIHEVALHSILHQRQAKIHVVLAEEVDPLRVGLAGHGSLGL